MSWGSCVCMQLLNLIAVDSLKAARTRCLQQATVSSAVRRLGHFMLRALHRMTAPSSQPACTA